MSDKIISVSIDVTQLDEARFVPGKKVNKKGVVPQYANVMLMLRKDGPDEYGNAYFIKQGVTKEEREAKLEMPIIGNAKIIVAGDSGGQRRAPTTKSAKNSDDSDSVPF